MRIVYVYMGILSFKGRLHKQLNTLVNNNMDCILIHGRVEDCVPDYKQYQYPVISIVVTRSKFKIVSLISNIIFNIKAAIWVHKLKAEYIVCEELWSTISGILTKVLNPRVKFIFDCNELFMHMSLPKAKKFIWYHVHYLAFSFSDVIFHAEANRMEYCRNQYKNTASHFLLQNLPQAGVIEGQLPIKRSKQISLIYIGAFLPDRCIEEIISAFAQIDIKFAKCDFIGFGNPQYEETLKRYALNMNANNIKFLPPVPNSQVLEVLSNYDIGLVFYKNTNLNQYYCAPNKLYEYILCGLPIITNNYPGLIQIVQEQSIGVCIDSIDANTMISAINQISENNYWKNFNIKLKEKFLWDSQVRRFCDLFKQ